MDDSHKMESRVARLEGSVQQIADSVDSIAKQVDRVATAQKPNLANMAMWAGVVLTIAGMMGALLGVFIFRELDMHQKGLQELDAKLQREFNLINATTSQEVVNVDTASKERHDDAVERFKQVNEWINSQTRADLDELRQRRLKDSDK